MSLLLLCLVLHAPELVTDDYVDDARCARCHADISHGFSTLGMGRSFTVPGPETAVADFSTAGGTFRHDASGLSYRMWLDEAGHMWMRQFEVDDAGDEINGVDIQAHFAVGSANHARTYLHRTPSGELWELPVSWYAHGGWNMSPGFDRKGHDGFSRRVGRECIFCHNAYPDVPMGDDRMGRPEAFPETLPAGIGCQRCHGPGRRHVDLAYSADATDEAIAASILNPADLDPAQADEICLQCHLQPTSRLGSLVRPFDRGDFSYRPGEPLDQYLGHIDYRDATQRDPFEVNHHAFRLRASACWQGEGSLTCLSCHDPHHKPAPEKRAARYRAACLQCHGEQDCHVEVRTGTPLTPGADCTTCHMPTRRPTDAIHTLITDHRIQIPPLDPEALRAPRPETSPPTNVEAHLYRGDARLADVLAGAGRIVSNDNAAATVLASQLTLDSPQPLRLIAAEGLMESGKSQQAMDLLRDIVTTSPWIVTGQVNLALLEAQLIGPDAAIARLQGVVLETPLAADAWERLGTLLWAQQRRNEAVEAMREATRLRPVSAEGWRHLGGALASTGDLLGAIDALQRAQSLHPGNAQTAYNLGLAMWRLGNPAGARRHWQHALGRSPDAPKLLKMAAIARVLPLRPAPSPAEQAAGLQLARRWASASPEVGEAKVLIAMALLAQGDGMGATSVLQQAADQGADQAAVRMVQAMLLHAAGRTDEANVLFNRVSKAIDRPDRLTMLRSGLLQRGRSMLSE
jgi:predicted CXXCH cytochrome family protein